MKRILLYSTDHVLTAMLCASFEDEYSICCLTTEPKLLKALASSNTAAIIIDGSLNRAVELCQQLRASTSLPIVAIANTNGFEERVRMLRAGADDAISFPFELEDLRVRLHSKLRRAELNQQAHLNAWFKRRLLIEGHQLHLSPTEARLLTTLRNHAGTFVPASTLQQVLWEEHAQPSRLRFHISHLRQRLAVFDDEIRIETQRGYGYRLVH